MKIAYLSGAWAFYAGHPARTFGMYVSRHKCHSQENKAKALGHGARPRFHPEGKAYFRQFRRHFHIRPFIIFMGPPAFFSAHLHFQPNITLKKGGKHYRITLRRYPVGMERNMRDGLRFGGLSMF